MDIASVLIFSGLDHTVKANQETPRFTNIVRKNWQMFDSKLRHFLRALKIFNHSGLEKMKDRYWVTISNRTEFIFILIQQRPTVRL